MKKVVLAIFSAIILASCGGSSSTSTSAAGVSEKDLIAGFESTRGKFNEVFENPKDFDQQKLKPLNDSLVFYVDAIISNYPSSSELPEVLCRAGVTSLNVKNSDKALLYLNYVVDSFPEHPLVPKSMYFIGRTKEVVVEDLEGAKEAYKKLYRAFPNSTWGMNARTSVELIVNPDMFEESTLQEDTLSN